MTAQPMTQSEQDMYASTRQSLLFMLENVTAFIEDARNPEEATYSDMAELNRTHEAMLTLFKTLEL